MSAATVRRHAGLAVSALALLASACASAANGGEDESSAPAAIPIAPGPPRAGDQATAVAQLERRLSDAQPEARVAERFWASYELAEVHSARAYRRALRGQDLDAAGAALATSGFVSAIDDGSRARELLPKLKPKDVPTELAPASLDTLRIDLDLLLATSYARLGFFEELAAAVALYPDLRAPDRCASYLAALGTRAELRPWICAALSVYLRSIDELDAYRFAILAIEGSERFGFGVAPATVDELETWILEGASVRFVCPRSQTTYVVGQRVSPVSGVPHIEYVAVERTP